MKQNRVGLTITLLVGGIVMLLISVSAEYVISQLRTEANRTFQFWPVAWARTVAPLLLTALFLGLAWFAMRTAGETRAGGILLLILGLPAALFIPLFSFGLFRWLPGSVNPMNLAGSDYLRFTGAFLTVLGVYLTFRPVTDTGEELT